MATFSASPAPRRSRPAGNSPTNAARRLRVGSSRPASHRGTPVQPTPESHPFVNDSSPMGSSMDVDQTGSVFSDRVGKTEVLFAKSEEMSVAFYANLPVEVKQVLKNAGEFMYSIFDLVHIALIL
jgi:nuclear pore complex protein Nup133